MNFPRRFIFRGNASGVAAHIRRPVNQVLHVQAASSLPVTGGISESKAGPQSLGDYLSFQSAETSAQGDFVDPRAAEAMTRGEVAFDSVPTKTTVTARVRGLHVGKRFTVGIADANLVSHSPQAGSKQPSIQTTGNRVDGVFVDGYQLKVTLDEPLFTECDTLDKLSAAYSKGLGESRAGMFRHPDPKQPGNTLPAPGGIVLCTIVAKLDWEGRKHPDATIDGNLLIVPNFGQVYFGELLITDLYRRLTLVRLQLGSPDGGDASLCDVESNGSTWPPG